MERKTSIQLAASPEVAQITGQNFVNGKPAKSSRRSYDKETAERLWQVSSLLNRPDEQ